MTKISNLKVTLVISPHHKWISGLRGSSLVIEYLLDKEFGTEVGSDTETADRLAAEKIVKAQRIIELMRTQKRKQKNDPDDKNDWT